MNPGLTAPVPSKKNRRSDGRRACGPANMNGPLSPSNFGVTPAPASLALPTTVPGIIDLFVSAPLVAKVSCTIHCSDSSRFHCSDLSRFHFIDFSLFHCCDPFSVSNPLYLIVLISPCSILVFPLSCIDVIPPYSIVVIPHQSRHHLCNRPFVPSALRTQHTTSQASLY